MQEDKHTKIRLREWLKKEHPFRYLFFEEFGSFPIIATSALFYIIASFSCTENCRSNEMKKRFAIATFFTFKLINSKKRWTQTDCLSLDLDCEIYPDEHKEKIERKIKGETRRSNRIFLCVVAAVILYCIAFYIIFGVA